MSREGRESRAQYQIEEEERERGEREEEDGAIQNGTGRGKEKETLRGQRQRAGANTADAREKIRNRKDRLLKITCSILLRVVDLLLKGLGAYIYLDS